MNYEESTEILEKIKLSKNILINCHRRPDADTVGSALALYQIIRQLRKEVEIICSEGIPHDFKFLPFSEKIKTIDYRNFDFKRYDLFLICDSSDYDRVTGDKQVYLPEIFKIVIDHHITNNKFGDINLVKPDICSVAEIIYRLLEDWGFELNKDLANCLLTGIIGDTGVFQFSNTTKDTFEITTKLIEAGADTNEIVFNTYRSVPLEELKIWGEILSRMKIDKEDKFVYSIIPFEIFEKYSKPSYAKETTASMFSSIVDETDFGMIMVEEKKDHLAISFRSRTDFDVTKIASELGGGGHEAAAGARINGPLEETTKKVLEVSRKYAKRSL